MEMGRDSLIAPEVSFRRNFIIPTVVVGAVCSLQGNFVEIFQSHMYKTNNPGRKLPGGRM